MGSMELFDSHCHLDFSPLVEDRVGALSRFINEGGVGLVVPGYDEPQWRRPLGPMPPTLWVGRTFGVHPYALRVYDEASIEGQLSRLPECLKRDAAVGIGEFGYDALLSKRDGVGMDRQKVVARHQLALAIRMKLPVVLHVVRAHGVAIEDLEGLGELPAGGMVHAYTGSVEMVTRYVRLGLYLSIGPAILRPQARRVREAAKVIPDEALLVETDAPDQHPPTCTSGEPAQLIEVVRALAQLRGQEEAHIARVTYQNACRFWGM